MWRRCNGRIAVVLKTDGFGSAVDLEQTFMRCVACSSTQLPQSARGSRAPIQATKLWHTSDPHLFVNSLRNLPGRDARAKRIPI